MIRALLIACAVLLVLLGIQTWRIDRLKAAPLKQRVKTVEKIVYRQAQAAQITEDVGNAVEARQIEVRTVTRTVVEKIPYYVTPQTDARYLVPLGFVRLHDAAAGGTPAVPFGAGESADTPSGVALSAVTETIAFNYGQCRGWREQVIGWQDWYRQQQALWNKP
jgi:hypothetical protein